EYLSDKLSIQLFFQEFDEVECYIKRKYQSRKNKYQRKMKVLTHFIQIVVCICLIIQTINGFNAKRSAINLGVLSSEGDILGDSYDDGGIILGNGGTAINTGIASSEGGVVTDGASGVIMG
ncbi:unnamed protein product, partial [Brachionus calyciflorus]